MSARTWLLFAAVLVSVCTAAAEEHGEHPVTASTGLVASGNEEHWAAGMCTEHTAQHYAHFNEHCHTCVHATKGHGDPTRCHSCLKVHGGHGHMADELVEVCLKCVPTAETKNLGWACKQYCTHHGIINGKEQAEDCIGCLMAEYPHDKWSCHVCMEQVPDNVARRECYSCIQDAQNAYQCASCARVTDPTDRAGCWSCMKKGTTGKDCAARYGVKEFTNPSLALTAKLIAERTGKLGAFGR